MIAAIASKDSCDGDKDNIPDRHEEGQNDNQYENGNRREKSHSHDINY